MTLTAIPQKHYTEMRYYVYGNTGRTRVPDPEERRMLAIERETGEKQLFSDEFPVNLDIIESKYTDSEDEAKATYQSYLAKGYYQVYMHDFVTDKITKPELT